MRSRRQNPSHVRWGRPTYLEISPAGVKLWRLTLRIDGKEKRLALGTYPAVRLLDARHRRDEARKQIANGIDPAAHKQAQKATRTECNANSFEVIAHEWLAKIQKEKAESHYTKIKARLEKDVFPWLGSKPVASITAQEVLTVLRRIEKRGTLETTRRARGNIGQVVRHAIATGRAERGPCPDFRGALSTPN